MYNGFICLFLILNGHYLSRCQSGWNPLLPVLQLFNCNAPNNHACVCLMVKHGGFILTLGWHLLVSAIGWRIKGQRAGRPVMNNSGRLADANQPEMHNSCHHPFRCKLQIRTAQTFTKVNVQFWVNIFHATPATKTQRTQRKYS